MNFYEPSFSMESSAMSGSFHKLISGVSDLAVAVLDVGASDLTLTSFPTHKTYLPEAKLGPRSIVVKDRVTVSEIRALELNSDELKMLDETARTADAELTGVWRAVELELSDGGRDRIAMQLDPSEDFDLTTSYLRRIWPVLRSDCMAEQVQSDDLAIETPGLSWNILNRIDVAILILDGQGLMYRVNVSAREMLDEGLLLRRGTRGLLLANKAEDEEFRKALLASSTAEHGAPDQVVMLTTRDGSQRVPVTLSRYIHQGTPTKYVVAMMPTPPCSKRVEMLVRQMGLTSSEARVAALIQLGLSNREAAELSGLKPQTFNTYAKRVLSKLNVSGRAEMAQLLTWQSAGGRAV